MRISHAMFSKGFGGAERSFVDTVDLLAAAGHEVQAICHTEFAGIEHLQRPGVSVAAISVGGEWNPISQHAVTRALEQFRPHLVHAHLRRAAWFAGRAGHALSIPVVAKLHNYVDLSRYRYVDTLIATTVDECRYTLDQGWSPNRVTVIPNFSPLEIRQPRAADEDRPLRLVSYGRFVHKKGFDLLLNALHHLRNEGYAFELTLGGDGNERSALEEQARSLQLDSCVQFVGWVEDVAGFLDEADLFVLSSRSEPFGIVLLEAMARGVPIVSTWAEGPREILDGTTTYFASVDSGPSMIDALRRAFDDPRGRLERAQRALGMFCQRYSATAFRGKLLKLYEQLIQDARRSSDSVNELSEI